MNKLLVNRTKRNWKTRCGAFLLACLTSWYGGNAMADVILQVNGNWLGVAPNPVYDFSYTEGIGNPGAAAHTQFSWDNTSSRGNNLNDLIAGITVNVVPNPQTTPATTQTRNLTLGAVDTLTFTAGGGNNTVRFTDSLGWGRNNFSVAAGATGRIECINDPAMVLYLDNHLDVDATGTLIIAPISGNFASSRVRVGNSSNAGKINLEGGQLEIASNSFGGGGTIEIGSWGNLYLNALTISQDIIGNYDIYSASRTRGQILVMTGFELNPVNVTGHLSGNVSFDGGGVARLAADNSGNGDSDALLNLYIRNQSGFSTTQVIVVEQDNVGQAAIFLSENGALSRSHGVNNLTISNDITVGVPLGGSLDGTLNSLMAGTAISWKTAADQLLDNGFRFTLTGTVSSHLPGATININEAMYGNGTVALTNTGNSSNYYGNYVIHRGVFEIRDQSTLGGNDNMTRYSVSIGSSTNSGNRATFRVVGELNESQTIDHWIDLVGNNSFYEVFTVIEEENGDVTYLQFDEDGNPIFAINGPNVADADRFKVIQSGQVHGSGDLNKSGDGTLVLSAANGYTGNTNIWHGVLSISEANNVNNAINSRIRIGGEPLMEDNGFRPVFETNTSNGTIVLNAGVVINQTNSIIRTTGIDNETVLTNAVTTDPVPLNAGVQAPYPAILNKDGAGTLTLQGLGQWGRYGAGELVINQGTVKFARQENLTSGDITIGTNWRTYKDLETGVTYQAILKLENNNTVALSNKIILASPAAGNSDPAETGSYIDVGTNSVLTLTSQVVESVTGSDLNKIGLGSLVLKNAANGYTGWTNIYGGTVAITLPTSINPSKGVDLVAEGAIFDMSANGASQTLRGLRGGTDAAYMAIPYAELFTEFDDPSDWTRKVLIGDNTLTLDLQNFKTGDVSSMSYFRGHIVGTGTLVKKGLAGSTFAAGFEGFSGAFDIQTGTLTTLTDATITGISGKAGTYLDMLGNTLTVNIGQAQTYSGYIVSSAPVLPYTTTRPHLIKDGAGTLTAGFNEALTNNYFQGDLTIKQGNITSTTDYKMEGGSNLTFYLNSTPTGTVSPTILDVGGNGTKKATFLTGGVSGNEMTNVYVVFSADRTGWQTPEGSLTVAKILANAQSNYDGLQAVSDTNSLYHSIVLTPDTSKTGRHDMLVNVNVVGFSGVGNTFNTTEVGKHLDAVRVTDLTDHGLAPLLQDLWAAGSSITADNKEARLELARSIFQQLSADTIANAMFMGLDKPWQRPFDRLNLDSQMVYLTPPGTQQRGQAIANMRNIWFTPSVQQVTMRTDGNARRAGIDRPGYQVGFDKRVAQNTSVGFVLGYSSPKLHQGDDRVEASDFQCGLYGGAMVGSYVEMKGYIGFGHQNYKSNRTIYLPSDDVCANGFGGFSPIGGTQRTLASHGRFDGDTFNFSFEFARPLFLGFAILRPTIGLDSEHAFRYGFSETGDATSMSFKRASLSRTRARFGLGLETCTFERAIFTGRLGYSTLLGGHDYATIEGKFLNTDISGQQIRSVAVGKSYLEAGVGTRVFLNPAKTLVLVGNYDASIAERWVEHQALVGFKYTY